MLPLLVAISWFCASLQVSKALYCCRSKFASLTAILLAQYDSKLCNLLESYTKCFIVHADNVGSRQFQDIRRVRVLCSEYCSLLVDHMACLQWPVLVENQMFSHLAHNKRPCPGPA